MPGPLSGVRVLDIATVIAGPGAARHLADFGADVLKVEAPAGDPSRRLGWTAPTADVSYYWQLVGRGKRTVVLDLKTPDDRDRLLTLVDGADLLIENMRPGKLEALGLGPDVLAARRPQLVVVRVTAFGQRGPYAHRPGFATLAEAMSGWAAISGEPAGKPMLPPVALTDEVTALSAAYAAMTALWHARATGVGQVVEVNLLETMLQLMGPLPSAWAHLGYEQPRLGGGIPYSVPRNTYRCRDDGWIAVSSSSDALAARMVELLGLGEDARFVTFEGRVAHAEVLDDAMAQWCAQRATADALVELEAADVAGAPVYSMSELFADEHAVDQQLFIEVDGVVQTRPVARMSRTPPEVRWVGRPLDADTAEWSEE